MYIESVFNIHTYNSYIIYIQSVYNVHTVLVILNIQKLTANKHISLRNNEVLNAAPVPSVIEN